MTKLKASEVLRKAARACELVEAIPGARTFSCAEICKVLQTHHCDIDVEEFYRDLYVPGSPSPNESCWAHHYIEDADGYGPLGWNNDMAPRVIALCLAAAIAESEGK